MKGEPVKGIGKWAEKDNQENEGSEKPRAMWLCRWRVGEARHESESPLALLTFPASTGSTSLDREEPCGFKAAYEWARTSLQTGLGVDHLSSLETKMSSYLSPGVQELWGPITVDYSLHLHKGFHGEGPWSLFQTRWTRC